MNLPHGLGAETEWRTCPWAAHRGSCACGGLCPPFREVFDEMGTAAPGTSGGGYDVSRPQGKCGVCGAPIEPDQRLMTALRETPAGYERIDVETGCWEKLDRKDVVAFWQTVMPRAEQKKK